MYITSSVPSPGQVAKLLKFLESNKWLTTSQARTAAARDRSRAAWQYITVRLNNTEGCKKSWQQWSKYWKDKKSMVKKKASQLAEKTQEEIPGCEVEMSETEQRIYAIFKVEMGNMGRLKQNEKSDKNNIFKQQPDDDEYEMAPEKQEYNQPVMDEVMNEYNSRLMEETSRNSSVERDPLPSTSDPIHLQDDTIDDSTSKRKRTRMEELTERFLKIEERRVEIEFTEAKSRETLANTLEEMSKVWKQQSDALTSLAESVRIMVERNTSFNS